ncbi:MAG TPA: ABC transporter permease, partial [Bacillota bacterium]|nr:ABC transporter permease [Bacillota bacterium]
ISVLTIFISVYIPARRASKISAIDAIRQSEDIKLTNKKVKTSTLVRKLFGFEAEIGLKNLKRNKKRYIATVFSLFISIVLFLSVSFFTDTLKRTVVLTQDGYNYDIAVSFDRDEQLTKQDQEIIEEINQFPDVTDSNLVRSGWLNIHVDATYIPEESRDQIVEEYSSDTEVPFGVHYYVFEDDALEKFADEAGVPSQQLHDTDSIQGIIINWTSIIDLDENVYKEQRAIDIKQGEELALVVDNYDDESVHLGQLTVAGISDSFPMGVEPIRYDPGVNVIISETAYEQLHIEENDFIFPPYYKLYLTSSDAIATGDEITALEYPGLSMFNISKMNQDDQQFTFVISVFAYGFITLITLISVANIFNTITTSIALRKREFGMLKSVGMTPKGFNKMIRYESIFYGLKALLYGLPVSIGFMYLMHIALSEGFVLTFKIPWIPIGIVIVAVFVIVSISMVYASAKLKKQNIIDALKQENM